MTGSRRSVARALMAAACVAMAPAAFAADITLRARLETTETIVAQGVTLTVEAQGAQDVPAPEISAPDGVSLRYVGPSTQVSIVNGRMSTTIQHRYIVIAQKEGAFSLGPFTVSYDGKQYEAAAVRFRAVPGGQAAQRGGRGGGEAPGARDLTLRIDAPQTEVYVQQRIPVTVTLTVGVRVDDLQYPALIADGFAIDPFEGQPSQTTETRGGRTVRVLRFPTRVVPLRSGTLTLGPARMSMSTLTTRRGGSGDPFLDQFFGMDPFAQKRPVEVQAEPVTLAVRPLPEEGKPADFGGAVGQFDFEVTAQPVDLRAGDPLTVRMRVTGAGNYAAIEAPRIDTGDRFKVYAPQASGGAAAEEKVFEQALIPLREDVRELPAIRFSFFDPVGGGYRTIEKGPWPLTVRAPEQPQGAKVVEAPGARSETRPAEEKLGRDIVFIKETPGTLLPRGQRFYRAPWFLALQLAPLLAYAACWWYARQRDRLRTDQRYARFTRAGPEARAALAAAQQALRGGDGARFDDELSRALRDYLAAKLDLPPGAVEAEQVAARLGANGAEAEVSRQVVRVLDVLEHGRYAGSAGAGMDREEALHLAQAIVAALERRSFRVRGALAVGLAVCVSGAALAGTLVPALLFAESGSAKTVRNPNALFYEANKLYGDGRFADAAAAYEEVLAGGHESAAVYYNLGNAYFKQGRRGPAILGYERARRLAPRDPDGRANMQLARDELDLVEDAAMWRRVAFFIAERLATGELAVLTSLLYAAAMLALCARALWPLAAAAAARLAIGLAAVAALSGANLAHRVLATEISTTAIVTRGGETAVRFEPSADGTAHFVAKEGTALRVLERRQGWLQVARADGRRGWVETAAVGVVD